MVDFKSYFEYQPPDLPILGSLKRLGTMAEYLWPDYQSKSETELRRTWDGKTSRDELSDDHLMLCPPRVLGYALEQKRWVQLHVNKLRDPEEASPRIFEVKLQLGSEYKDMIRKTVQAHSSSSDQNIRDYTPGKGKGLVIMLWGKRSKFFRFVQYIDLYSRSSWSRQDSHCRKRSPSCRKAALLCRRF